MLSLHSRTSAVVGLALTVLAPVAPSLAQSSASQSQFTTTACPVSWAALRAALSSATATETSGLNFQMWGTVVNRDGVVCAVAFTGADRGSQWPGSRVISAQKANTANAFSLPKGPNPGSSVDGLALSTANLYSAVQPGGSLFGLQESNPVNIAVAYAGNPGAYGTAGDPLVGQRIGGVNVFGGGLALYDKNRRLVGAVGVSGDTSCADHFVAWRTRNNLGLDYVSTGVSGDGAHPDNIIFDLGDAPPPTTEGTRKLSPSGFGHPRCIGTGNPATLPAVPSLTASSH
jgi:uncharacterized protein GlcG (DUF336 family)